ncbi:zinc finger, CCHC-type containing protein [Tanacetum coccineum]|uniref:Zinc finger, CCHC-type containing protein n=1 Tax=Tanacetum coccineum TaxID=301880 RepID=A0ABQ4XPW4_9ASTR
MEFQVGDRVMLKVSPWKGVVHFGKRGKLNQRYVGPFKVLAKVGAVAYKLELPQELSKVHNTFYVSNLKKCYFDEPLAVLLDGLHIEDKLCFVEEPVEIMDREVKRLKYFEDYYSEDQYAVSIKEDTVYPCLHSPKTTKERRSIRRIQKKSIRRIEDIVCEYSGRYQTWSLLQETPIHLIMEYLVNISKRRAFWSLNEDILKITILKTNTPYPSRKIRCIRACTHQRPQRKEDQYAVSRRSQYAVLKILCMIRSSTNELFTPYNEPEQKFRSSRRHFKMLSLDELRSLDFNLLSDQEYSEEEVAETMAETMEQYMSKTRADYGLRISRPKIEEKDNFELKGQFLKELRTNTFSGSDDEDANEHIEKVLEIVDLFHIPNITIDQVMLRAFPMSLTRAASRWLRNELTGLITTWDGLKTKFLNKYCPPARTAKKMEEINNFQQELDENLYQA